MLAAPACFGDPGLDAVRELVEVPVVGIAEAAMRPATIAGRSFGIVTTLSRTLGRAQDLLHRYGFDRACVGRTRTRPPTASAGGFTGAKRARLRP